MAKNAPPEPGDFEPIYHKDQARANNEVRKGRTKCQTMGLSVYTDVEDAIQCAGKYRSLGKEIVQLTLTRGLARVALTEGLFDSHHTLWVPEGFDLTQHSQVIRSM